MNRFIDQRTFEPVSNPSFLTQDQIDSYNRDGVLVLRNVIPLERIEAMKNVAKDMFYGDSQWVGAPEVRNDIFNNHLISDEFQKPLDDLNGKSTPIQGFLYRKQPTTTISKYWHQDGVYWGGEDAKVIAVFTPLTPMTAENGILYYYPGSHKLGRLYHRCEPNYSLVCDVSSFKEPESIELFPGDLFFLHSLVVHASFGNPSNKARISLGFHCHNINSKVEINEPTIVTYNEARRERAEQERAIHHILQVENNQEVLLNPNGVKLNINLAGEAAFKLTDNMLPLSWKPNKIKFLVHSDTELTKVSLGINGDRIDLSGYSYDCEFPGLNQGTNITIKALEPQPICLTWWCE